MKDRVGSHRTHRISRWKTFSELGLPIPGGSDCPIEVGNPLFEFYAAVTRQDHSGWPIKGFQSQEKVNRENALKMFTTWAAYGGFDEYRRGKIEVGYDADLTIMDQDILKVKTKTILNSKILYTIVNGNILKNQQ